jgi:hypothetical protein
MHLMRTHGLRSGNCLVDCFALGREPLNVTADELFQVRFTLHEEAVADSGELVETILRDCESKLLHVLSADQFGLCHAASFCCAALNLS